MTNENKYNFKYEESFNDKFEKIWTSYVIVTEKGSINFWYRPSNLPNDYYGGIETHYKTPPDYMRDKKPSHVHCPFIDDLGACWHDGSSFQAEKYIDWIKKGASKECIFVVLKERAIDYGFILSDQEEAE